MSEREPQEGDLKAWYIPQVPMNALEREVPDVVTGYLVLDAWYDLSCFEFDNRIKPDYSDVGGVARFEDGEWYDVEEDELERVYAEYMADLELERMRIQQ